jgi:hypothetical protein
MKNALTVLRSSAAPHEGPTERREWVKPVAKSATVAEATLTGHTVPPITDFVTCAS